MSVSTFQNLKKAGVEPISYGTGNFGHELNRKELHKLAKWLFTERVEDHGQRLEIDSCKYDYNKLT